MTLAAGVLFGTLAAVVLLITLTSTGMSDTQDQLGEMSQIFGAYVWAFLLLLAAMLVLIRHRLDVSEMQDAESLPAVVCADERNHHVLGNTPCECGDA